LNKVGTTEEAERVEASSRPSMERDGAVRAWPGTRAAQPEKRHGWLSLLRSFFFIDPLIWAYTLVLGTVSLGASFFDSDGRIQHKLATAWSWLIMKTIFSPVTVTGNTTALHSGAGSRPRVFAVTHASALDIPVLYVYQPFQFRIIFKSELLSYPFVGWHLRRSGQVCINQQKPSASVGAIKSALKSLRRGMPLVIFPEGGRTQDGNIQPFLPGAFFLAIKAEADIVPVALVGTFELLPMNTYHIKCQPLEMRVGDVIPTAGLTMVDMDAVSAKVKSSIEALHSAPRTTT
jgi:1-acyl-sn-glycerol-3-phosphate acyltransferase